MGYKSDITSRVFNSWQEREAFELGARAARVTVWTNARHAEFGGGLEALCEESSDSAAIAAAYRAGARQLRGVVDPWGDGVAGFEIPDAR